MNRQNPRKKVRIRPTARRIDPSVRELIPIDDCWRVDSLLLEKLRLVNARTNHVLTLSRNQIKDVVNDPNGESSGVLILEGQVILKGSGVFLWAAGPSRHHTTVIV
jgi:hypothetical protein